MENYIHIGILLIYLNEINTESFSKFMWDDFHG